MSKLLVVDDEQTICRGLTQLGESIGYEVATASSAEQAFQVVEKNKPDVIILDVRLPGMDGLTALKKFQDQISNVPVIVITAYGDLNTAVTAMQNGAFEYIVKPFDLAQMEQVLQRAVDSIGQSIITDQKVKEIGGLIGRSPVMQQVFKNIALAASSNASVMLSGESGTGKELTARAIHQFSGRGSGPFVAVNIASLSDTLAESELFGHVQGAFTGAEKARSGLLAQANGGTLFLDEVADIPLPIQVKLLRVLDQSEFFPVGSNEPLKTNFRVISATHQSLENNVREKSFRHDLYFRLCGFQIEMPALRERPEDIPELAEHFLNTLARGSDNYHSRFSEVALAELQQRSWYGNVRELRNVVEHAVLLARGGIIQPELLPPPVSQALLNLTERADYDETVIATLLYQWAEGKLLDNKNRSDLHEEFIRLVEKPLLEAVLKNTSNQCTAAARILGLHRTTLKKKLDQHRITQE
ncbi:MAG: sigma-54-dependent Fis family transcriptional regulator [Planctomycetaceae bacterium]|nr:sigma-54-dependent Fis family transcriptional regulator [Planctomycetaceae bacterium]